MVNVGATKVSPCSVSGQACPPALPMLCRVCGQRAELRASSRCVSHLRLIGVRPAPRRLVQAAFVLVTAFEAEAIRAELGQLSSPPQSVATSTDRSLQSAVACLENLPEFRDARFVRVDRDLTQSHNRLAVLKAGKMLLVPPPGLLTGELYVLDPAKIDPSQYMFAVSHAGVKRFGEQADLGASARVDLAVFGSVAVSPITGARNAKRGSFSAFDLEVLHASGAADDSLRLVTSVDDPALIDVNASDEALHVHIICTPSRTIRVSTPGASRDGRDSNSVVNRIQEIAFRRVENAGKTRAAVIRGIRKRVRRICKEREGEVEEGFELAAARISALPEFRRARVVRASAHRRSLGVRLAALRAGKLVIVPEKDLVTIRLLDPQKIDPIWHEFAMTNAGVKWLGEILDAGMDIKVDLVVIGSLVVNPSTGCRVSPVGSMEDLEYGMSRQMGWLDEATPVVTAMPESHLLEDLAPEAMSLHTVPVDIVCTPERTLRVPRGVFRKPRGVYWQRLPRTLRKVGLLGPLRAGTERRARLEARPCAWRRALRLRLRRHVRAKAAASRLQQLREFRRAGAVAMDLDPDQLHIGVAALRSGKLVLLPSPEPSVSFFVLSPSAMDPSQYPRALSPSGVSIFGRPLELGARISAIVVTGSVAVDEATGQRRPRVAGAFSIVDYGNLRSMGGRPLVVTLVDDIALARPTENVSCSDVPADIICTPTRTVRTSHTAGLLPSFFLED